ncbi:glycosyltransferase family 2 protein [Aquincola sp. MAHUQ-54]|uniref:Glycosyltransferase family 2 protein n=1 Tax=Aquincola agrisoli TaxID=3119538 RepID=A0AAW9QJP7_9BURK
MAAAFPPPRPGLRASVVVPVRDEARRLPAALQALADQHGAPPFEVLVLVNNTRDDSAAIARRFAAQRPDCVLHVAELDFAPQDAHVGHARRWLMDEASHRLAAAGAVRGVIASTDGDSRVAPGWLAATLAAVDAGADAVGGRLLADADAQGQPARAQRWDTLYRLARERLASLLDPEDGDPWPRHHQHFGASLAVTAEAYGRVGGVPPVRWLEDEALVEALRRADARVRHSPAVRVVTSSRRQGRVDVGLSWQLREWDRQARQHLPLCVEGAGELLRLVPARRRLRRLWRHAWPAGDPAWPAIEALLALRPGTLGPLCRAAGGAFGAAWAAVCGARAAVAPAPVPVPIDRAVGELRRLIAAHTAHAAGGAGEERWLPLPRVDAAADGGVATPSLVSPLQENAMTRPPRNRCGNSQPGPGSPA